jgi:hypothetical protein
MSDRGMMKWLPYKSLDQQSDFLAKMAYERGKKPRPLHSNEEAEAINDLLVHYHDESVLLRYYRDGYIGETRGIITEINTIYKYIRLFDEKIDFRDIVYLSDSD